MVGQGAVHGVVSLGAARAHVAAWLARELWGTVTPELRGDVALSQPAAYFWSGPASFAIPVVLLGALTVRLAGTPRGVPASLGWSYGAWGVACAAIHGPATPFATALVPAALIVLAADGELGHAEPASQPR